MKVSKLFCMLLVAGALGLTGCGDDGGGKSASDVCSGCQRDAFRAACEQEYDRCVAIDPNDPECESGALVLCD